MKKILLVFLLLGLLGGWTEKPNEKEKIEVSSVNLKEAETYYNNGIAKYNLKNYVEAILDFNKSIELNLKFAMAYNSRGVTKNKLQDYEGAILDYDKSIELNPKYIEAYNNRGNAKRNLKKYDEAILDYNKANELNLELKNLNKD